MKTVRSEPDQMRISSSWIVPRVSASSAPNGSSSRSSFGWIANARAMDTRWRMPPDSCAGFRCSAPSASPTIFRNFSECSSTRWRSQSGKRARTPKVTFLSADFHGSSE